jgi:molybdenum cofactor biosynthesis enzyme MoaA
MIQKTRDDGTKVNFNFILTEECNWDCEYCQFPRIKNPKTVTMEQLKMHLEYIKDFNISGYMDVQGGEIGLVPENILEYFLETMGRKMYVSTNGIFLNKKMHLNEKIRPYIKMIQWHIKPEVYVENIKDSGIIITRGIVHNDADEMIEFLNNNKHLYIEYIDFEYSIDDEVEHDRAKYMEFYQKLNHLENISEGAKKRIRQRAQEKEGLRNACTTRNDSILIDLVNEKICLCQRNMHVNVDLGLIALWNRCWNDPTDYFLDLDKSNCYSCGRLYHGKTRNLQGI